MASMLPLLPGTFCSSAIRAPVELPLCAGVHFRVCPPAEAKQRWHHHQRRPHSRVERAPQAGLQLQQAELGAGGAATVDGGTCQTTAIVAEVVEGEGQLRSRSGAIEVPAGCRSCAAAAALAPKPTIASSCLKPEPHLLRLRLQPRAHTRCSCLPTSLERPGRFQRQSQGRAAASFVSYKEER